MSAADEAPPVSDLRPMAAQTDVFTPFMFRAGSRKPKKQGDGLSERRPLLSSRGHTIAQLPSASGTAVRSAFQRGTTVGAEARYDFIRRAFDAFHFVDVIGFVPDPSPTFTAAVKIGAGLSPSKQQFCFGRIRTDRTGSENRSL